MSSETELRKEKLQRLKENQQDPFQINNFFQNTDISTIVSQFSPLSQKELKEKNVFVSVAGRISRLHLIGGLAFADLTGPTEKIQLKLSENEGNQTKFKDFSELLDIGDIIGVKGIICKTNRGELSIDLNDFILLSKCLNPIPNKLIDEEERFRKRYLDLIVNRQNRGIL